MMTLNLQKMPPKGILKTSRSYCKQDVTPSTSKAAKEQRFNEMNIKETFHPPDKDYGHMKVDKPKTKYYQNVDFVMFARKLYELDTQIQKEQSKAPPKLKRRPRGH